jgi:hypothetical protein
MSKVNCVCVKVTLPSGSVYKAYCFNEPEFDKSKLKGEYSVVMTSQSLSLTPPEEKGIEYPMQQAWKSFYEGRLQWELITHDKYFQAIPFPEARGVMEKLTLPQIKDLFQAREDENGADLSALTKRFTQHFPSAVKKLWKKLYIDTLSK